MKIYEIGGVGKLHPGEKRAFAPSNSDPKRSFEKFLSDCSDAIAAMKVSRRFLYRGVSRSAPSIFIGKPRKDRNTSLNPEMSKEIDDKFFAAGFKAARRNSIFCSASSQAAIYGTVYLIFPVNGFNFTWSPIVHDFITSGNINVYNFDPIKVNYQSDNFVGALNSGNEIMVHGKYYAFDKIHFGLALMKALLQ